MSARDGAVRDLSIIKLLSSEVLPLCCGEHFHLLPGRCPQRRDASASESNTAEDRSCVFFEGLIRMNLGVDEPADA